MNKTIFLVDDDVSILKSFQRLFLLLDSEDILITTESAEEALKITEEKTPDIFICDLYMPGMSGRECLEIIKKQYPNCKTILLTGDIDTEKNRQPYIDFIMSKPCHPEKILRLLRKG